MSQKLTASQRSSHGHSLKTGRHRLVRSVATLAILTVIAAACVGARVLYRRISTFLWAPQPADLQVTIIPDWFEVLPKEGTVQVPELVAVGVVPRDNSLISGPCRLAFAFDSIVLRDSGGFDAELHGDGKSVLTRDINGVTITPAYDPEHVTGVALATPFTGSANKSYFVWHSGKKFAPAVRRLLDPNTVEISSREVLFSTTVKAAIVVMLVEDTLNDTSNLIVPEAFVLSPTSMGSITWAGQARMSSRMRRSVAVYAAPVDSLGFRGMTIELPQDYLELSVRDGHIEMLKQDQALPNTFALRLQGMAEKTKCYSNPRMARKADVRPPAILVTLDRNAAGRGAVQMASCVERCAFGGGAVEATIEGKEATFAPSDRVEIQGDCQYAFYFEAGGVPTLRVRGRATSLLRNGRESLRSEWSRLDSGVKGGLVGFVSSLATLLIGALVSQLRRRGNTTNQ